jgi:hypothetical protein
MLSVPKLAIPPRACGRERTQSERALRATRRRACPGRNGPVADHRHVPQQDARTHGAIRRRWDEDPPPHALSSSSPWATPSVTLNPETATLGGPAGCVVMVSTGPPPWITVRPGPAPTRRRLLLILTPPSNSPFGNPDRVTPRQRPAVSRREPPSGTARSVLEPPDHGICAGPPLLPVPTWPEARPPMPR